MTLLVRQRTLHDCAICCMAMVSGKAYELVLEIVGDAFEPDKGMRQDQEALKRLGYRHDFEKGHPVGDISCTHRGFWISAEFYRSMAWGRRALMTVPSLNFPDGHHMIYWDGRRVLDPSTLKTYSRWDELLPSEMVLFQERW
ncbi:MAG TPA: hypothetical protein VKW08_07650 [Xanthobacteraceae bacterium]|jgi:hypothetical protein|nr:hypothetical protein [Xanthobacteraceae bacterium]